MAEKTVQLTLSMALDEFNKSILEAQKKMKGLGDSASLTAQQVNKAISNMESVGKKMSLGFTLPVAAVNALGDETVKSTGRAMGAIDSLLGGNADKVAEVVAIADDRMKKTTFGREQLIDASARLINFGTTIDQLPSRLQMLTDISKGTGIELEELTSLYTRMGAKGTLAFEDLKMFAEKNINVIGELSKEYGLKGSDATKQLKRMADDGQVSFEALSNALANMTEQGGVYYNKAENAVNGYAGAQTKMMNNTKEAAASWIESVKPVLITFYQTISKITEEFSLLNSGTRAVIGSTALFLAALGPAILLMAKLIIAVKDAKVAFDIAKSSASAFGTMIKSISFTPFLLGITVVVGAIAGLYAMLHKTTVEVEADLDHVADVTKRGDIIKNMAHMSDEAKNLFGEIGSSITDASGKIDTNAIPSKIAEIRKKYEAELAPLLAQRNKMGSVDPFGFFNSNDENVKLDTLNKKIESLQAHINNLRGVSTSAYAEIKIAAEKANAAPTKTLKPDTGKSELDEEANRAKSYADKVKKYLVTAGTDGSAAIMAAYKEEIKEAENALAHGKITQDQFDSYLISKEKETNDKIDELNHQREMKYNESWAKAGDTNAAFADKINAIHDNLKDKIISKNEAIAQSFLAACTSTIGGAAELANQYNQMQQTRYNNQEKKQLSSLKKQYEAEKSAINNSTLSASQKASKLSALETKYQNDQEATNEKFEKKKADAAYKAAVAQKAQNIFSATMDIPVAAQRSYTAMAGIPFVGPALATAAAIAATAFGVAKLGMIVATPIPKAATGTILNSATHVIAGEAGTEALVPLGNNENTNRGMTLFASKLVPYLLSTLNSKASSIAATTKSLISGSSAKDTSVGQPTTIQLMLDSIKLGEALTTIGDRGYYRVPARIIYS